MKMVIISLFHVLLLPGYWCCVKTNTEWDEDVVTNVNAAMERHIPSTYGWRVKLDHVFPEKPRVFIFPRLSQVTKLAGMAYRYVLFTRKIRKEGKMPFIDPYAVSSCKQIYGVPLGGLGAGTIGRGWRGDFNRWQLTPGIYTYNTVYANQFTVCIRKNGRTIYQQVLAPYTPPSRSKFDRSLSAWRWEFPGGDAHYHGLYPRAWTIYNIPHLNVKLTCRQVSPVFPHNYKDTSLPVGVFIWTVENNSMENLQVSVMFTFQNGDGTPDDWAGGHSNEEFLCKGVYSEIRLLKKSTKNTQNTDKYSNNNKNLNNNKSLKTDKKLTNDAPIYDANGKTRLSNINCKPSSGDNNANCKQLDDDNSITNRQDIPMDTIEKNPSSIKGDVKTSKVGAPSVSLDESYEVISISDNEVSSDEDEEKMPEIELSSPHEDVNCKEEVLSSQAVGGCLKSTLCEKERRSFDDSHETCELHNIRGVMMHHNAIRRKFTLAIAAMHITQDSSDIVNVSTKVAFDPNSTASDIWDDLHEDGALTNKRGSGIDNHSYPGHALASAVCAKTKVKAGGQQKLQFVLVWDQPVVTFGSDSGLGYCRRYTRFFGSKGNAAPSMCCYALQNVERWEGCIDEWQTPILNDSSLPSWFKSALFNELYFMSDGGTIWLDMKRKKDCHGNVISDKVKKYGRFAYLEGHEYRMYNTYDVHFYSSWALIMLWPHLQISLQYDIGSSVLNTDAEKRLMMMEGGTAVRKLAGCVPHDLGDPEDEPFVRVNAYCIHDTSRWKDLNLHFVLQVYRDYHITKDKNFLMHMWPAMKAAMAHSVTQDTDGDGIIDNSGFADNTFDCWIVTGPSAYTGGLWLSALKCIIVIADILDLTRSISKYKNVLERGCRAFERKLWNGMYFNYDGSENEHHNSIMAGQCAGQWYLHACDLATAEDAVFRREQIRSTLKVIFQNNVMRFEGGFMGAVNGMRADGTVDRDSLQAEEVWTGVTYALAATMIQHGMVSEGFRTAEGVYRTCYEKWGLAFQTPEAITAKRTFRSRGYMRPLSIWSMYHAICARKLNQGHDDDNFKELRDNVC